MYHVDHWKISKNKDVPALPSTGQQMKNMTSHWKLNNDDDEDDHLKSSIHLLVNRNDIDTFEDGFSFGVNGVNETLTPDNETDAEGIMEVYETPPTDRRVDISPDSPNISHATTSSSSSDNPNSPTSLFQSFRITPGGMSEIVQAPHGRRFRLSNGVLISSTRNPYGEPNSPPLKRAENPSPSSPNAGRARKSSSSVPPPVVTMPVSARTLSFMTTHRNTDPPANPFAGMPGAVAPITTRKNSSSFT